MALKITTTIGYKKPNEIGVTNESYIVIENVVRTKDGQERVSCKTFKNKADRDISFENISILQVPASFTFMSSNPDGDFTKTLAEYFGELYGKIASEYASLGLTTENI